MTPKATPASQSLDQVAKDQDTNTKNLNTIYQQAKSVLDSTQKALSDELDKSQKAFDAKVQADKHYKSDLDHIADVKKRLAENSTKAQNDFNAKAAPISQNLQLEQAQIQGLIPIVRKENGWPETVNYNLSTQKWADASKPAEAKK